VVVEAFNGQVVTDLRTLFPACCQWGASRTHRRAPNSRHARGGARDASVREALCPRVARQPGGRAYGAYDPEKRTYALPPGSTAMVLVLDQSPIFMAPAFFEVAASFGSMKTRSRKRPLGRGLAGHEHNHRLFCGTRAYPHRLARHLVSGGLRRLRRFVEP